MTTFVEKAFKTPISPELLADVLGVFAELEPDERQSYEVRAFRVFQLLDERREPGDRAALAFAIQLRLEALARLHDDRGLRAWTLPGEQEGMDYVHGDVVSAAAAEPLISINAHEAGFDRDTFRARVLASAATRGSA